MKVNFFMYVVFRYLYTQPQPINNAIYNIQEKVYLEIDNPRAMEQGQYAFINIINFPSESL